MNFEIVNIRIFKINVDFYPRVFSVLKKRNGLLRLRNVLTGIILIDNLDPATVLIENEPMQNLRQLQAIILNQECLCDDDGGDVDFKIFDRTFDRTFE